MSAEGNSEAFLAAPDVQLVIRVAMGFSEAEDIHLGVTFDQEADVAVEGPYRLTALATSDDNAPVSVEFRRYSVAEATADPEVVLRVRAVGWTTTKGFREPHSSPSDISLSVAAYARDLESARPPVLVGVPTPLPQTFTLNVAGREVQFLPGAAEAMRRDGLSEAADLLDQLVEKQDRGGLNEEDLRALTVLVDRAMSDRRRALPRNRMVMPAPLRPPFFEAADNQRESGQD